MNKIGACYCATCRKINGGGPLLGLHGNSELKASGQEHIERYASSDWAERGFCKKCGTTLFYHLTVGSRDYIYSAGLFENADFEITSEIFVDAKPDYMGFLSENSVKKTTQQVFDEVNKNDA
ncbi:GFA family protein [Maritalea myrionectae]|nr:GFA family protein [Maritalea myrionectae]